MNKIKSILITTLVCMMFLSLFPVSAAANDAAAALGGPKNIYAGDEIEITLSVGGANILGINGELSFEPSQLKLKEVTKDIAGDWDVEINTNVSKVYFAAVDKKSSTPIKSSKAILTATFTVSDLNVGDMISVSANSMQASAGNGLIDIGETVFSKKISDRNQSDNGGNANSSETQTEDNESNLNDISLSSLIVKNAVITPDFSPQIKNYEATVPFEIEELEVEAVAANENAKVTISDTKLIYVGTNITRIVVEAENGSKRTYKITTTREDRIKSDTPETEKTAGMPVWGIVLIIVGAVILLAVIVIAILLIVKSKRRNQ